jgi:cytosine/adenosine deaminase-related metal-dependent hydrolase
MIQRRVVVEGLGGLVVAGLLGCGAVSRDEAASHARPSAEARALVVGGDHGAPAPFDPARGLLLHGTVVTMNDAHDVIEDGNVLVRGDRIVAVWRGPRPPAGIVVGAAAIVDPGPGALIFPGMINLHSHPTYNMLSLWAAPSSQVEAALGRPLGTEPYANRYQWNNMLGHGSPELQRLVSLPQLALTSASGLGLEAEVVKYAKVKGLLGGETTFQDAPSTPAIDGVLGRSVESPNFGRQRVGSSVGRIDDASDADVTQLRGAMAYGLVDAWLFHIAEGVRDGDRRPGDDFSSRAELHTLRAKGLLTDMTVVIHGVALEAADFAAMRAAPSIRLDGSGDGLGAKLVWSPLSNLLLYGRTANVYEALAAGLTVSLGTDWSPSGSRNLLGEIKIADLALRDPAILGASRDLVPELSLAGKRGVEAARAEMALDGLIVDMVTRNPAATVRWRDQAGSIEAGKAADLFVVTDAFAEARDHLPRSPYRSLIDATERDVRLVLVGGEPLAGDVELMAALKPGDSETIASACGLYRKAVDVTRAGVDKGDETLASIETLLNDGLVALGGDAPPPGGGPADDTNTYSYLEAHVPLPFPMTDAQFRQLVLLPLAGTTPDGKLNLEGLTLTPLLADEDDFFFDVLGARLDAATHAIADPTPPYMPYPANLNQLESGVDPFSPPSFEDRFYPLPVLARLLPAGQACARLPRVGR